MAKCLLYTNFWWDWSGRAGLAVDIFNPVSFSIYNRGIKSSDWIDENDLGKTIMIGELHFGALDRGMIHECLVLTKNQAERALAFRRYVESVADCPAFAGCHWFKFTDEPFTGRTVDGENYNIGLAAVG